MIWTKLQDMRDDQPLFRGSLFRYRRMTPKEEILDYMLFATHEGSGLGLVRDCGYDAGNVLVILPAEAKMKGKGAISPEWLSRHWQKWVDGSSASAEVWVCTGGRAEPEKLPEE